MSKYIYKRHNESVLLYHMVCPTKYRRVILTKEVDETLKNICLEIAKRYEIEFIEIGVLTVGSSLYKFNLKNYSKKRDENIILK